MFGMRLTTIAQVKDCGRNLRNVSDGKPPHAEIVFCKPVASEKVIGWLPPISDGITEHCAWRIWYPRQQIRVVIPPEMIAISYNKLQPRTTLAAPDICELQ